MMSDILAGWSYPLGATVTSEGVNFCIFSKNCTAVELLLFDSVEDQKPSRVIPFDPVQNRTFYYWHMLVPGLKAGQLYAYRVYGPYIPAAGFRFDGQKVLLDPYARAIAVGSNYDRAAATRPGDNCAHSLKGVVLDPNLYNWESDRPLARPLSRTAIYELHVGGFTRHPSSGVAPEKRGTYAGLIEKIPYLVDLGVSAVELLPVQQFDDQDAPAGLSNYWGYSPINFFAPHSGYSSRREPLGAVDEFRDMVKALHRAGIEVILDVVFNHSAEGNQNGPTLSYRGLENRAYYILEADKAFYANYSGCGNTINANQSIVRRLIMDCLRYWVAVMHVDGFRFDLASALSRDEWGQPLKSPPLLWEIESEPILAGTKIIAEAWDAAGLYQVGTFIGHRWAEWNGQFRDDVRRFVKGDSGTVSRLAQRLMGSPDLYPQPKRSINFITCHDGFTLNDLVSYNSKHNEANREGNRDGSDTNNSWNCGSEGPTTDLGIEALRVRQIKNLLTLLMVSEGTPMLMMGDEARHTQNGNNNAYCQNTPLSWLDWSHQDADVLRFTKALIAFVMSRDVFHDEVFWTDAAAHLIKKNNHQSGVIWHGIQLNQPDWADHSHSIALTLDFVNDTLHIMINAYWESLLFDLPSLETGQNWYRIIDTAQPTPGDICAPGEVPVSASNYRVEARSLVIVLAGSITRG
jgi:glycogen operon protein